MAKTRVLVLRGGTSPEFNVSLETGETVLHSLPKSKYEPIDVVIAQNGDWLFYGRKREPSEILHAGDIVWNALHGTFGEDGGVQRLLERFGMPYTGSRPYPSLIAMNKAMAKDYIRGNGINLPKHVVVGRQALEDMSALAHSLYELIGTPTFILKPIAGGSSIDTAVTRTTAEFTTALSNLLGVYEQVLIEEYIQGREATCGVIENFRGEKLYALPVVEIVLPEGQDYFSLDAKYNTGTIELVPSTFSSEIKKEIERQARLIHELLGLSHYSRSDFIVSPDGIYFLEVNTLPGLTPHSLIPKALAAVGSSHAEFVDHILTEALQKAHVSVR